MSFEVFVFLIILALAFDFMNGFHDAANSIATVVSTGVLRPHHAVAFAAFFNFAALFIFQLKVAATVGKGIVVAAGTQRVVPLSALALGEENPIVRVTAAQAPVQASLQSSLTRVLAPIGVDQSAAVGAPDTTLVIPGVAVSAAPGPACNSPTMVRSAAM